MRQAVLELAPGSVDEWAEELSRAVPGPESAGVLGVLDAGELSGRGRVDALRALERHVSWVQSLQVHLLAALDSGVEDGGVQGLFATETDRMVDEVACALKLSGDTAASRLSVARALVERLPGTLGLLEAGEISWMQAKAVADLTEVVDEEAARRVEAACLPRMPKQSCGQTRRAVRDAIVRVDPQGAQGRHEERRKAREIRHGEAEDGMAYWGAFLPSEEAAQLDAAVDAHAAVLAKRDDEEGREKRTLAQRRVDALVDLVVNRAARSVGSADAVASGGGRSAAVVQVVVGVDTLMGIDEAPARLKGYGPITAAQARRIAFGKDVIWRRLLTEPKTGMLIKTDPTTYKPTAEVARHVTARDGTCMFPPCHMPAHRCDIDHIKPFNHQQPHAGGQTAPENLLALCRRHHRMKHHGGWSVERDTHTGAAKWTASTGHTYTKHPHTYA